MYCECDTQLKAAKVLTFLFALIMSITTVGCLTQIVVDIKSSVINETTSLDVSALNVTMPAPAVEGNPYLFEMTTWYVFMLLAVFILTGILHGGEVIILIYGVLYWLCLPSGHLLLTIYSIANLTDRSWGTREGKSRSRVQQTSWKENVIKLFTYLCWCCIPPQFRQQTSFEGMPELDQDQLEECCVHTHQDEDDKDVGDTEDEVDSEEHTHAHIESTEDDTEQTLSLSVAEAKTKVPSKAYTNMEYSVRPPPIAEDDTVQTNLFAPKRPQPSPRSRPRKPHDIDLLSDRVDARSAMKGYFRARSKQGGTANRFLRTISQQRGGTVSRFARNSCITVEEWLPAQYHIYMEKFKEHGYDNASFIAGVVKERDLIEMGIMNRGHRKKLVVLIEQLPPDELLEEVPDDVEGWLINLGLEQYWQNFSTNSYTEQRDLADLKYMTREDISTLFNIKKEGHLRKLLISTTALQYPTKTQKQIRDTRKKMLDVNTNNMSTRDVEECEFWRRLREICLLPEQAAFNHSSELVDKLAEMRSQCFVMLVVANVLWLTFIGTIIYQGKQLHMMGASFAGVAFTFVNAFLLLIQFVSLLVHRVTTLMHFIARAPFIPGHFKGNWAWNDSDMQAEPDDKALSDFRQITMKRRTTTLQRYASSRGRNVNLST